LTYTCAIGNLPGVKRFLPFWLLIFTPATGLGQAPDAASLWDIAGTTLAQSPALESGATGAFWNPTAILEGAGLRVGIQAVETPDVLGLSGILAGASQSIGPKIAVGVLFGRIQVSDLVRTSTSPLSQGGDIPVYEQLAGLALGASFGPVRTAVLLRGHDARFDLVHGSGLTLDLGASVRPNNRLRIAATSQFVPADLSNRGTERYYAGVEYQVLSLSAWGTPARFTMRYGAAIRDRRDLEHTFGAGLDLGQRITLDSGLQREEALGNTVWRFVLAIGVRAGRYSVLAARGGSVQGLGANYRVGLDVDLAK